MATTQSTEPILIEVGPEQWKEHLDSVEAWLDNLRLMQSSFRKLAEDTAGKIRDPRIKEHIACIADAAKEHEATIDTLYAAIGRRPPGLRATMGTVAAKARELLGDVAEAAGGAAGAWRDLRQMMLSNLDSMGAFGSVEQLGYTLGLLELATIAFDVVRDKSTQQLLLQEFMLETAPQSILYDQEI